MVALVRLSNNRGVIPGSRHHMYVKDLTSKDARRFERDSKERLKRAQLAHGARVVIRMKSLRAASDTIGREYGGFLERNRDGFVATILGHTTRGLRRRRVPLTVRADGM